MRKNEKKFLKKWYPWNIIILVLLILLIIVLIWGGVTQWRFVPEPQKNEEYYKKSDLLVWGWAINPDRKKMEKGAEKFLNTAKKFNLNTELIGIGYTYKRHLAQDRFYVLRDFLKKVSPDQIIVVMDSFDTLINGASKEILRKFKKFKTRILFSAETGWTWQYEHEKHNFENEKSPYKYIAAGTYMGYAKDLQQMNNDCIELLENPKAYTKADLKTAAEMGIMGIWVGKYIKDKSKVRLDTNCEIFWVTTHDNDLFEKQLKNVKITNPNTKTNPLMYHIVGATREKDVIKLYQNIYDKIMNS